MNFLKVENLTHNYNVAGKQIFHAINNITFSLEKGEILGIIGHTGSGKSTLVSHLNGLLKPDTGKVLLEDKDIWENPKEISKIRSRVGLVFQYPEYQLFEETVYKDIAFGPRNMRLDDNEIDRRIRKSSEILGIGEELFERSPFDLSGGQKRRVAIAGIMAMEPELIVFDEPTAGLDPQGRLTVFRAINDYKERNNAAVIIVSHSMEDMASICDKILVLNKGKVFDFGSAEEIFSKRDELLSIGLNAPIISEVIYKLGKRLNLDTGNIITVDKACEYLLSVINERRSCQ